MELNSTKENMITKTKLFESNLQMGREIYFMKESEIYFMKESEIYFMKVRSKKYGFRNYIWIGSGNLSSTKGPAQEILNESERNPDPRSRNLQLWSWKINSPKINASYYSKFQSLASPSGKAAVGSEKREP